MKKWVTFLVSVELDVSDAVLDETQGAEWQGQMYRGMDRDGVMRMLAYNVACNGVRKLSSLDGFADRADSEMSVVSGPDWEDE